MKRWIIMIMAAILAGIFLSGCGQNQTKEEEKLSVVCTIYPQYDWVKQILGEENDTIEVTLLLDDAIDLHSYQPTVADIAKISDCDLFIYGGGTSDEWVEDIIEDASNEDRKVIQMLDILGEGVKVEEVVEGMEEEAEEAEDEEQEEYDEHVWLSLKNAQLISTSIAEELSVLDKENAQVYEKNLSKYIGKLKTLDTQYDNAVKSAPVKTLLFGDRFPFRYLVDDYDIEYYAAFPGCSAETEASFGTIVFLAEKLDEMELKYIMVTKNSDESIAKTIKDTTKKKDQEILAMDAMQSITATEREEGITYLSIMEENLSTLKKALQ